MIVTHKKSGRKYDVFEWISTYDCRAFKKGEVIYRGQPINPKTGKPWQAQRYLTRAEISFE